MSVSNSSGNLEIQSCSPILAWGSCGFSAETKAGIARRDELGREGEAWRVRRVVLSYSDHWRWPFGSKGGLVGVVLFLLFAFLFLL